MWPRRQKDQSDTDSRIALAEAQENLARIERRGKEIRAVTAAQRKLLERNQFVERLNIIMGGSR